MFKLLSVRRKIRSLQATPRLRLHVGCGKERLEGWVNLDLKQLPSVDLAVNVTQGLPFSGAELVFAEHFLEHLTLSDAVSFLEESHRALAEGGWIRLSTPNLDWILATHHRAEGESHERTAMALALNRAFRGWEHQFLWNREMLEEALEATGFTDLAFCEYGESGVDALRGMERHETYPDTEGLQHVLIVEARKGEARPDRLRRLRERIQKELLDHLEG